MAVCLVAHIPNKLIVRCVINIMQRHGKLHHTQAGAKMAAMHTNHINNILAKFVADLWQIFPADLF